MNLQVYYLTDIKPLYKLTKIIIHYIEDYFLVIKTSNQENKNRFAAIDLQL